MHRFALRRIRERSGMSASELARRAHISHGTLLDIESGRRNGSPSMLRRIAAALKVELVDILADPEDSTHATLFEGTLGTASEHDVLNWLTAHHGARELIAVYGSNLPTAQRRALRAIAETALERLRAHGVEPEPAVEDD
ncbi:MAG: helix-turn-helix domain-containing protein [Nitriliruptorales bacterium]